MSIHGLLKLHNACNTASAWQDWAAYYQMAVLRGLTNQANDLKPQTGSGWRKIDAQIAKLKKLIVEHDTRACHRCGEVTALCTCQPAPNPVLQPTGEVAAACCNLSTPAAKNNVRR